MQLPDQLRQVLPPAIRQLLAPDARQQLLQAVNTSLLLFDDCLLLPETGEKVAVSGRDPEQLARAARDLLPADGNDRQLLLLLPPKEFVATTQTMPGVSADSLASALALQVDSLLPACDERLALAVNPAAADFADQQTALWMRQARLDALFSAFAEQGLFLAAVQPRLLAVASGDTETRIIDKSAAGLTAVAIQQGVITQWLQADAADLEQDAFAEQWQQELKSHPTVQRRELASAADYADAAQPGVNAPYHFFPAGALHARHRVQQQQRWLAAAAAVVAVLLVSAIPFVAQSLELRSARAELASNRALAADARADQQAVVVFENEWGALDDFPDQDIRQAMFTLQDALAPDQLTSLEISEGLISIEGSSNDPQAILQRLEQDPLFTEVVFARATNNTRYYIDLRLSPVNFEAYMRRYFPDD